MKSRVFLALMCAAVVAHAACGEDPRAPGPEVVSSAELPALPGKPGSLRFAVIGDSGRGSRPQYEIAQQMVAQREHFPFDFVLMLGDNVYDTDTPEAYRKKFEEPYKPLLDAGVKFYATRGNHDVADQWLYQAFNTGGHRYFTFEEGEGVLEPLIGGKVRFFAVDSVLLDQEQIDWLGRELAKSGADWKICFFHHPLYTSGRYSWASVWRRRNLEPLLTAHGVDVVFSGHEHVYERLVPQRGIVYFVSGGAGSVRVGDLHPSALTAKGFDRDLHFMLIEIAGDTMYFQAVSRTGETVDGGRITKKKTVVTNLPIERFAAAGHR